MQAMTAPDPIMEFGTVLVSLESPWLVDLNGIPDGMLGWGQTGPLKTLFQPEGIRRVKIDLPSMAQQRVAENPRESCNEIHKGNRWFLWGEK